MLPSLTRWDVRKAGIGYLRDISPVPASGIPGPVARMVEEGWSCAHPVMSVRWMGQYCDGPVYQVRSACVYVELYVASEPSGEHTPGEAIAGVVARPADGSSA